MWRVCAVYGLPVMSLDGNYPLLCRHLGVPPVSGGTAAVAAAVLARESYLAIAELVRLPSRLGPRPMYYFPSQLSGQHLSAGGGGTSGVAEPDLLTDLIVASVDVAVWQG